MKNLSVGAVAIVFLLQNTLATAQVCSHIEGNWLDSYFYAWSLAQSGNNVSGSVYIPSPCNNTWEVSGTKNRNSLGFSLVALNPTPLEPCVPSFTYVGSVSNEVCDVGGGNWQRLTYPWATGGFAWAKSCDVPTGETTISGEGGWVLSLYNFNVAVTPPAEDLAGRRVAETSGPQGSDGCYFTGSTIDPIESIGDAGYEGASYLMSSDNKYGDLVGWTNTAINYYRAQQSTPCWTTIYQWMRISCSGTDPVYKQNTLVAHIEDSLIKSARDGVWKTRSW